MDADQVFNSMTRADAVLTLVIRSIEAGDIDRDLITGALYAVAKEIGEVLKLADAEAPKHLISSGQGYLL